MTICHEGWVDRHFLQHAEVLEQTGLHESVPVISPADTEVLVAVLIYYVQSWQRMIYLGCV